MARKRKRAQRNDTATLLLCVRNALLGSILSFMMAVTTLSLPSMIMLRKAVKPRLLALFIAICSVGIIIVGYFFNFIQGYIL